MNNFIYKVCDISRSGSGTLFKGKIYGGAIEQGQTIRFVLPNGGYDSFYDNMSETVVSVVSRIQQYNTLACLELPYSDELSDLCEHLWIVNKENSASMVVSDVFKISGRGIVVTGVIASGIIRVGDKMSIITPDGIEKTVVVSGIEQSRKLIDEANIGDTVGVLLNGVKDKTEIPAGSILCAKVTIQKPETSTINQNTALVVSDIFDISGRGIVITGKVLSEYVIVGDVLQFSQYDGSIREVIVRGIEKHRKLHNEAKFGDDVGLLLGGLSSVNDISIGTQLSIKRKVQYQLLNTATSHKKIALLIGNCNYGSNGQLKNCINDALALGKKLESLGFETILITDGNKEAIDKAINDFSNKANNADVGFVFYSGHGMQYNGENYMIPIGATLNSPADIDYRCNRASYALSKMEDAGCRLKILVLDACRTNPFTRGWYRGGVQDGLGVMGAPSGTIVAFATSPNSVASDGYMTDNSPYTYGLLKHLDDPELDIVAYFNKVSSFVYKLTNEQQNPWFSCSALTGDFYLAKK